MADFALPLHNVAMATVEVLPPHLFPPLLHLFTHIPPHARKPSLSPQNGEFPRCFPCAEKSGKVEQKGTDSWF